MVNKEINKDIKRILKEVYEKEVSEITCNPEDRLIKSAIEKINNNKYCKVKSSSSIDGSMQYILSEISNEGLELINVIHVSIVEKICRFVNNNISDLIALGALIVSIMALIISIIK